MTEDKKIRVYIASPYTNGNAMTNIRRQMDIANELKALGYYPYIPLMFPFFELVHPHSEEDLLDWEISFLEVCDIVVRLRFKDKSGKEISSEGADIEIKRAKELGIPVYEFNSMEQIKKYLIK